MELPAEIERAATNIVDDASLPEHYITNGVYTALKNAVASALLAERLSATERAAKIAEDAFISAKGMKLDAVSVVALQDIAAAIRSQP